LLRTEETSAEVARLRRCVNDLVSVLGLPMMWAGHEPSRVATTLLDVLVQMLELDFGYLRVGDPTREPVSEWLRAAAGPSPDPAAVGHALETYLSGGVSWRGPRIAHPFAEGTVSIAVFHIGPSDSTAVFVAGSRRPDFPSETEYLVLQVATNQAAIALEQARQLSGRQSTTDELKRRVAETEDRLQEMADKIPEVIWIKSLDPEERPLYVSPSYERVWGLPLKDLFQDPRAWVEAIHPDDRERVDRLFSLWVSGGDVSYHDIEFRIVHPDGSVRWILERGMLTLNESGRPSRASGISTDITDRKAAEEKLREAFHEIRRLKDRLQQENVALREEVEKASMFEEIVGSSAPLRAVLSDVSKVAPTDSTVLITGETGTGKELIARAIHKRSRRSARAFVNVNCAAVPPSLIASELFGHEKGAFTGALQRRKGRFELADGGTIFLDEVGELPAETQIALLHVLQEREFERVGGTETIRVDVRVVAATNRDLEVAVSEGSFRADLFYRLNVFPLEVPALRERRADIPLLVEYFVHRFAKRAGRHIRGIRKETLSLLQSYAWPGNIRELQNVVERAVIVSESETLSIDERWLAGLPVNPPVVAGESSPTLASQEKDVIESALLESKGRVSGPFGAAARLGVPPSTLESKIKALKIDKRRFKSP
jgi:formate hydrogenlyase transcriptional activator